MSNKLYKYLNLKPTVWFTHDKVGAQIQVFLPNTISIKSDNLIFNENGEHNEIALLPMVKSGWHCPKNVNYVSLGINYVTNFKIYLTDVDNNPIHFNNNQFFIVLHFIK